MKKINIIILIILFSANVFAIRNPSAVYCEAMGYEFNIEKTTEGEVGKCKLPTGELVIAWEFLRGEVAQEYSYCEKQGYELKMVYGGDKCASISSQNCAVCVLENGEEVEVTQLMDLDFNEATCGDGVCTGIEENPGNCPQDCPSGTEDFYCDEITDGKCDPDCKNGEDPDCPVTMISELKAEQALEEKEIPLKTDLELKEDKESEKSNLPLIAGLSFLIIIIISGVLISNKMRSSSSTEEKDILKLKPYIINSRRKGYSKQQITQTLLKRGWNSKIIEKAFKFK